MRAGMSLPVKLSYVDAPIVDAQDEFQIGHLPFLAPSAVLTELLGLGLLQTSIDAAALPEYWARTLLDFPDHSLCSKPDMWARAVPIVLWGDEGTHNFKSWMLFSWHPGLRLIKVICDKVLECRSSAIWLLRMLDVSLWRTNSKASRNLAFACPVNMYRSHEKVNQTLQALLQAVKADLDGLAKGLEVCGEAAQLIGTQSCRPYIFAILACLRFGPSMWWPARATSSTWRSR